MKKWIRNSTLAVLCVCLWMITGMTVQAAEADRTVKVLIPLMNDSGFVTYENGTFSGYYIDYLNEIAKYTGWTYEFTAIESFDELEKACEEKNYDFMAGIVYSEEYDDAYFEYPEHAIGAKRYVFALPKNSGITPDKEYSYLRGVRIGVANNASGMELEERFRNFCLMYGINCTSDTNGDAKGVTLVQIEPSERQEKMNSGEIDGLLGSDAFCLSENMYAITTFGLDQIYFVSPNGRMNLLAELNDTLEKINNFDPDYNDRLYEKYFAETLQYTPSFDEKETAYLAEEHVFRVAMPENYAPYSYINADGKPAGIAAEVLRQITQQTGEMLRFEYVFYDTVSAAGDAVKNGICEINGVCVYSLLQKSDGSVRRSVSFYSDDYLFYKNNGKAAEEAEAAILLPELPEVLVHSFGAEEEIAEGELPWICLEETEAGRSSFTVMLSRMGDYYKSYYGFSGLSTYPMADGDVMFCFAYASKVDQAAISVIDKCLAAVEEEDLSNYAAEVSLTEHKEYTIGNYIKNHMEAFALILAGVLLVICAALVHIMIVMSRNSRKIHDLLYRDEVTGGNSYRKFLEDAAETVKEPGKHMVLYINISSFKYINDVFGYEEGDSVLCMIRDFLQEHVSEKGFARIYADRFVALVSYKEEGEIHAEIRQSLEEFEKVCQQKFPSFNIWLKVGAYIIQDGDDVQKAVNLANYAVDEIQKTSKNEFIFYDEAMHERVLNQKEIEKDMRGAMDKGEYEAFYQPKYNIETKELIGAEALIRWRHPQKGLLSPGIFIPIFEKNHYIIQVDFYVFECVCRFIRSLLDQGQKCFPISSNFSRLHLDQPDFVPHLIEIAEKYRVPPEYLEIEITETVAMADFDQLIIAVDQLKDKGFQVSIDDFGSGYSSIQLLYKLPIDVLKFDKAFVDHAEISPIESELVDSIITVSHRNGIKIICEGVETIEQEDFVRRHNCVYVQGFLYSRPVPEQEFREMVVGRCEIGID